MLKRSGILAGVSGKRARELQTGIGELLAQGIASGDGLDRRELLDHLVELHDAREHARDARNTLFRLGSNGAALATLLPASLIGGAAGLGAGLGAGTLGGGAIGGAIGGAAGAANGMYARRARPPRRGKSLFSKRAGVFGRAGELLTGSRAEKLEGDAASLALGGAHELSPETLRDIQRLHEAAEDERRSSARLRAAVAPVGLGVAAGLGGITGLVGGAVAGTPLGASIGVTPGSVAGAIGGWHAGSRFSRNRAQKRASFDRLGRSFFAPEGFKGASADDTVYESEEDARKRRLGELLRRRQRSGTDTGSLYPQSPRDNR